MSAQAPAAAHWKVPQSVLVLVHTPALDVLLLRRADSEEPFWQCVTGSKDTPDEDFAHTAAREVREETGLDPHAPGHCLQDWALENIYEIYPRWLHRYAPGVTHNVERVFSLCVPERLPVRLSPREHTAWRWLPWREAADGCYSFSNAEACLLLPRFYPARPA